MKKENGEIYDQLEPEAGVRLEGKEKRVFVKRMFDSIAHKYDSMNLLISLGQTSYWRKKTLAGLGLKPGQKVLDVGCGTGWGSRYLKSLYPGIVVEGMDLSPEMLKIAQKLDPHGHYFQGDVTSIPRAMNTYDLVMTLLTLRNFPSLEASLVEMVRVTKPGGKILILDTFPVKNPFVRMVHYIWLKLVIPLLVRPFISSKAYKYMGESILNHRSQEEVLEILQSLGCIFSKMEHYSLGIATAITVEKGGGE